MIKLIINADDFGLAPEINNAICESFDKSYITSTSAVVCGRHFEEGIFDLAKEHRAKVGLHICLDEEKPITNIEKIKSLVDEKTRHFKKRGEFLKDLLLGKINRQELYMEIEAQFDAFEKTGIRPNHLDSHGHLHVAPLVAAVVADICRRKNINIIRNPCEMKSISLEYYKRFPIAFIVSALSFYQFKKAYRDFKSPSCMIGLSSSGMNYIRNAEDFISQMLRCRKNIIELMVHPASNNIGSGLQPYSHWHYNWQGEMAFLGRLNDCLQKGTPHFDLIGYESLYQYT